MWRNYNSCAKYYGISKFCSQKLFSTIPNVLLARQDSISKFKIKGSPKKLTFAIPNFISVNKLANLLNCKINDLVKDLKKLGFDKVNNDYILSREYIELILQEYNYEFPRSIKDNLHTEEITSRNVYNEVKKIKPDHLKPRPPVVTIMGHIDHGKTTIIDYLRKSSIVQKESGGITQHIGAFQIETPKTKKLITFLDTPGHAAFLKMRERGANITDIIILVVSLEDSIMPQTLEAIKHIKASGNELIVAITKIDKITNPREREKLLEKIDNGLISHDIATEKIGGDIQVIPISAKTGENMDLLEESIISLSEIMDIKSENAPKSQTTGWVLESQVKKMVGNVATILIKNGTLSKGKVLLCGNTYCKVKNIFNEFGKQVSKATPSQAVLVLGWKEVPDAGEEIIEVKDEATAKRYISKRQNILEFEKNLLNVDKINEQNYAVNKLKKQKLLNSEKKDEDIIDISEKPTGPKDINFIIKADVSGSSEAVRDAISDIGNDEVKCNIISSSVGLPNDSDLKMAEVTNSKILCFNVGNLPNEILNNSKKIDIREYTVIYKLIEDVTEIITDELEPIYENKQLATIDLRQIFSYQLKKKNIRIAGCKITNGKVSRNSLIQIKRGEDEEVVYDGTISSLKQGKEDVSEIGKGKECGITFTNFEDYKVGDKIVVYEKERIKRYL
ncbi:hypothetical protein TPHA_0A02290 [Tetrapisispora phaffii CBS 4417]|uniref:Translation initiation factor IF-2, chloroplastic n=1 Tax=Tetrapisispora phaffii (strain ATCC 24235 / CBS 4417 / NBRC 1672 / NRRL Y-8282 / UCD 70-5) TaxID=1071381 RepID=G8BN33_TETPH|nr:hypothetical protein TPHA_0A02290 [Tetrapisispora phaffii CBS 4417]CCE61311.1 hypothetical protein TPHA_0A02290 [Tetrapisispora phaffii CBS 4417]